MLLEGRPAGWFTSNVELWLNGRSVGVVRARWFSEGLDLELGGHPVRFEKPSWLRSHFVLKDAEGSELGSATWTGFIRLRWAMSLKSGAGFFERAGWFLDSAHGRCTKHAGVRIDAIIVASISSRTECQQRVEP